MKVFLDTSFLIDLLSGEPAARSRAAATRDEHFQRIPGHFGLRVQTC